LWQQSCWSWNLNIRVSYQRHRPSSRLHAKGFAKKPVDEPTSPNKPEEEEESKPIYSQPALYDLAFGYRGFEEEVAFLWQRHMDVTGTAPQRILEVAAGPGRHCLTAITQYDNLQAAYCIDSSTEMQTYANDIAQHELSVDEQSIFRYHVADMRNYSLPETVDTAWILLGSLQHMTTNQEVRQCLTSVHQCLVPGGTLILELPHPRETFSMVECTRNGWKVPLEDEEGIESGELSIVWGDDNDVFDPITQIRQFTVRMVLQGVKDGKGVEGTTKLEEVVPLRLFTAQEIEALAFVSGFKVVSFHGALEEGVSVYDEDAAYRLVVVLQK
jgi:SAM-dependent methyltransferase